MGDQVGIAAEDPVVEDHSTAYLRYAVGEGLHA